MTNLRTISIALIAVLLLAITTIVSTAVTASASGTTHAAPLTGTWNDGGITASDDWESPNA